jgi:hypothetical protein
MEDDYEEIDFDESEPSDNTSFGNTVFGFIGGLPWKLLVFIFFIFIMLSSDIFIDKVLGNIDGALDHKSPTTKGVCVQATLMCVCTLIIDILIRCGFP